MNRILLPLAALALFMFGCVSAGSQYERAESAYVRGDFESALTYYRSAKRKDPELEGIDEKIRVTEIRLYLQRGDDAVQRADWVAARQAYEEAQYRDPSNPEIPERLHQLTLARANHHFLSGQELVALGNPFDAIPEFEEALRLDPNHPRAEESLELARAEKREREELAEQTFQNGMTARSEGRIEDALQLLTRATDIDPNHPTARRELERLHHELAAEQVRQGDALMADRRWPDALAAYERAYEHDPAYSGLEERLIRADHEVRAAALIDEGNRAFDNGDWQAAFERFDEAWSLTYTERESIRTRLETAREQYALRLYTDGQAAELRGNVDDAIGYYDSIDYVYPGYRDVRESRRRVEARIESAYDFYAGGCEAHAMRNLLLAMERYEACEQAVPGFRDVRQRMGAAANDLDHAEDLFDRAIAADRSDNLHRARVLYEECLGIANPFHDAGDRLERLGPEDDGGDYSDCDGAGRRAHGGRDLVRAKKHYETCLREHTGHGDANSHLRDVEKDLASAGELLERAHDARGRGDLVAARELYLEVTLVCTSWNEVDEALAQIDEALQWLEEARRCDHRRRYVDARKNYGRILEAFDSHEESRRRVREIDDLSTDLSGTYEKMVEAEKNGKLVLALSHGREIHSRCEGYEDVDERLEQLEAKAGDLPVR